MLILTPTSTTTRTAASATALNDAKVTAEEQQGPGGFAAVRGERFNRFLTQAITTRSWYPMNAVSHRHLIRIMMSSFPYIRHRRRQRTVGGGERL